MSPRASSTVIEGVSRLSPLGIEYPPPGPGVERSGTPISIRTCRSRRIVRLLTPNSSANSAAVKRGLLCTLTINSKSLAVRDNFLHPQKISDVYCHHYKVVL